MILNAIAILACDQSEVDSKAFAQLADYHAQSVIADTQSPGGFGVSGILPQKVTDHKLLGNGLTATLKKTQAGFEVWLANGSKSIATISAADSNIRGWLEAKDGKGAWRPIEFHHWSDCGNSYHYLYLEPGKGYQFLVQIPKGSLSTRVRWRAAMSGNFLASNELSISIPPTRFELLPELAKDQEIFLGWTVPTLRPKNFGRS